MVASSIGWSVGVLLGFGLVCSACGGSAKSTTPKGNDTTVCDPGTRRCDGDDIKRCNQAGTDETIERTCLSGQCHGQGDDVFCAIPSPAACTANQAICDGEIATKCKVDGSGLQPGGVDCAASKQHCLLGTCSDNLCIGGTKSCKNGDVYQCSTDGSILSVWDFCSDSEVCDEASGTCLVQRCVPNQMTCQGTRAVTCNASGSDWLPISTDCAAQGNVCVAGSCEKKTCAPSTTFCRDGNLYQCDPSGASSTLSKTCRPGFEHCELTPAGLYAYCVADACVAGQKFCDDNVIKTCNADGSRPMTGTSCGKGEICENAECKPVGCSQGTVFCQGRDVYSCQSNGPTLAWTCDPDRQCVALIADPEPSSEVYQDLAICMWQPCAPGETRCVHNQLGTCAADGVSLSAVTSDCAANGQVCTAATDCTVNDASQIACATPPTCAASVTDTLAWAKSAEAFSGSPYLGNVIDVLSARKLTELQIWLTFSSPRDLRWIVFEQVGSDLIARAEKTTSAASSTGFISSGARSFNYQLEAGKRYALGLVLPVGSVSYHVSAEDRSNTNLSFGSVLGSVRADVVDFSRFSIPPTFASFMISYMKVTTESP